MRYAGHTNFEIKNNPRGGWLAVFDCTAEGCGAGASATGDHEFGPYTGSCSRGHGIYIPSVQKGAR
jgi:hypothetical protein